MMVLPGLVLDNKPVGPSKTSLTAASLDNIVKTTSQVFISSCKLLADFAPAASNGASLSLVRLKTDTSKPALSRFITIGFPMLPRPVHPNFNVFMIFVLFILFVHYGHSLQKCANDCCISARSGLKSLRGTKQSHLVFLFIPICG